MRPIANQFDNLAYLDDYVDTIEAVPIELQRNFTLMRELDGYAQDLLSTVSKDAIELIDNIKHMDPNARLDKLKNLTSVLTETLKRGEEKVALAKSTFDTIDKHCNRLDADLVKFEEDQSVGNVRITTLPGLQPSSRSLKEGADILERMSKRPERKEVKGERKKRKIIKDTAPIQIKEAKATKNANGKPKTAIPADLPIDPNEPLYCYCQQVSYGEMVACDSHDCEIEWFHVACVNLKTVPKGKWYCGSCKGNQRR